MADEMKQWEYRVKTIGSIFGTKDEHVRQRWTMGHGRLGSDQCVHTI
jgi:hypothetical protein